MFNYYTFEKLLKQKAEEIIRKEKEAKESSIKKSKISSSKKRQE